MREHELAPHPYQMGGSGEGSAQLRWAASWNPSGIANSGPPRRTHNPIPTFMRSKNDADNILRSSHFSMLLNTVHQFDKENYFSL